MERLIMLADLAKRLSSSLGDKLHANSRQIQIYAYGWEILLGILIKVLVIIGLSLSLNV